MNAQKHWYELNEPGKVDSPALLIYKDRVASNIHTMIRIAGDVDRLIPHVKTNKMAEIVKMQLEAGITQFKCATIAEAEMLADAGAKNIVLAYQLTKPKALRFLTLIKKFPWVYFASLVDNVASAQMLNDLFLKEEKIANVFIDVDDGMHRTGIAPKNGLYDLSIELSQMRNLKCDGLHVYDGHQRDEDFQIRRKKVEADFDAVNSVLKKIKDAGFAPLKVIAGGTPTFTVHALNKMVSCSPGTCVLWDYGYNAILPEQPFDFAAVLITRVVSKPGKGLITTDLGHKSIAAENPISKRIFFLNLTDYNVLSQSEEHLVVEVNDSENIKVGDVLYGIPYHVCPTVALYDEANVIVNGDVIDRWNIVARKKKITI
ncbi:MAG TPA: D-TA family PLP-dependent enzyme [Hanamia sp.]|nr:D-TA family PLP-dependent enzyme [Hanamia sp.]